MDDQEEMSPIRVRVGLAMIAIVMVVSIGVIVSVHDSAARFLFTAILAIGVFQTWRIFRSQRRG
jgi:hypothetical protein